MWPPHFHHLHKNVYLFGQICIVVVQTVYFGRKALNPGVGTSLVVQWLRPQTSTAGGMGLIPGWGTKIPHAMQCAPPKKGESWDYKNSSSLPSHLIHPILRVCTEHLFFFFNTYLFGCAGSQLQHASSLVETCGI